MNRVLAARIEALERDMQWIKSVFPPAYSDVPVEVRVGQIRVGDMVHYRERDLYRCYLSLKARVLRIRIVNDDQVQLVFMYHRETYNHKDVVRRA